MWAGRSRDEPEFRPSASHLDSFMVPKVGFEPTRRAASTERRSESSKRQELAVENALCRHDAPNARPKRAQGHRN